MEWLRGLEDCIRTQVPLGPRTSYRVGGPAEFFCEPHDEATLATVLRRATEAGVPVRVLGSGSNLLVADRGVPGLVIHLPGRDFHLLEQHGTHIEVSASVPLSRLITWSADSGLGSLVSLGGVPGTVGAALRMNAGGKYGEIGRWVRSVSGYRLDGSPFRLDREECGFAYRNSKLRECLVTRCEMDLEADDPAISRQRLREITAEKAASQPMAARSAGCVFKNVEHPVRVSAGKLIDTAGLKGARSGGAQVSTKHANFLVCEEGATASDVAALIRQVRRQVKQVHGLELELEIILWGLTAEEVSSAA